MANSCKTQTKTKKVATRKKLKKSFREFLIATRFILLPLVIGIVSSVVAGDAMIAILN